MAASVIRRGLLLLALAWLGALPARAETALSRLASGLERADVIHADFIQTKTLQALTRPLRTSGRMVFVRSRGVVWRIERPYQASYALGVDSVTEIGPDGSRKVRLARDVPGIAQVGRLFEALFQGDTRALEEQFEVAVSAEAGHWQVQLAPKPPLSRFLQGISARGGRFLEWVEVREAQGDQTRIEFRNLRSDAPLSQADAGLLRHD